MSLSAIVSIWDKVPCFAVTGAAAQSYKTCSKYLHVMCFAIFLGKYNVSSVGELFWSQFAQVTKVLE